MSCIYSFVAPDKCVYFFSVRTIVIGLAVILVPRLSYVRFCFPTSLSTCRLFVSFRVTTGQLRPILVSYIEFLLHAAVSACEQLYLTSTRNVQAMRNE